MRFAGSWIGCNSSPPQYDVLHLRGKQRHGEHRVHRYFLLSRSERDKRKTLSPNGHGDDIYRSWNSFKLETEIPIIVRRSVMTISKDLLDILACPKCKGDIYLNDTKDGLICDTCKLLYEIKDDIPIMLIDEAKPIEG